MAVQKRVHAWRQEKEVFFLVIEMSKIGRELPKEHCANVKGLGQMD